MSFHKTMGATNTSCFTTLSESSSGQCEMATITSTLTPREHLQRFCRENNLSKIETLAAQLIFDRQNSFVTSTGDHRCTIDISTIHENAPRFGATHNDLSTCHQAVFRQIFDYLISTRSFTDAPQKLIDPTFVAKAGYLRAEVVGHEFSWTETLLLRLICTRAIMDALGFDTRVRIHLSHFGHHDFTVISAYQSIYQKVYDKIIEYILILRESASPAPSLPVDKPIPDNCGTQGLTKDRLDMFKTLWNTHEEPRNVQPKGWLCELPNEMNIMGKRVRTFSAYGETAEESLIHLAKLLVAHVTSLTELPSTSTPPVDDIDKYCVSQGFNPTHSAMVANLFKSRSTGTTKSNLIKLLVKSREYRCRLVATAASEDEAKQKLVTLIANSILEIESNLLDRSDHWTTIVNLPSAKSLTLDTLKVAVLDWKSCFFYFNAKFAKDRTTNFVAENASQTLIAKGASMKEAVTYLADMIVGVYAIQSGNIPPQDWTLLQNQPNLEDLNFGEFVLAATTLSKAMSRTVPVRSLSKNNKAAAFFDNGVRRRYSAVLRLPNATFTMGAVSKERMAALIVRVILKGRSRKNAAESTEESIMDTDDKDGFIEEDAEDGNLIAMTSNIDLHSENAENVPVSSESAKVGEQCQPSVKAPVADPVFIVEFYDGKQSEYTLSTLRTVFEEENLKTVADKSKTRIGGRIYLTRSTQAYFDRVIERLKTHPEERPSLCHSFPSLQSNSYGCCVDSYDAKYRLQPETSTSSGGILALQATPQLRDQRMVGVTTTTTLPVEVIPGKTTSVKITRFCDVVNGLTLRVLCRDLPEGTWVTRSLDANQIVSITLNLKNYDAKKPNSEEASVTTALSELTCWINQTLGKDQSIKIWNENGSECALYTISLALAKFSENVVGWPIVKCFACELVLDIKWAPLARWMTGITPGETQLLPKFEGQLLVNGEFLHMSEREVLKVQPHTLQHTITSHIVHSGPLCDKVVLDDDNGKLLNCRAMAVILNFANGGSPPGRLPIRTVTMMFNDYPACVKTAADFGLDHNHQPFTINPTSILLPLVSDPFNPKFGAGVQISKFDCIQFDFDVDQEPSVSSDWNVTVSIISGATLDFESSGNVNLIPFFNYDYMTKPSFD